MPPQGWGITYHVDYYFVQKQLKDLRVTKSSLTQHPAFLEDRPVTLTQGQYYSTLDQEGEDKGTTTSQLD